MDALSMTDTFTMASFNKAEISAGPFLWRQRLVLGHLRGEYVPDEIHSVGSHRTWVLENDDGAVSLRPG